MNRCEKWVRASVLHVVILLAAAVAVLPFIWLICASVKHGNGLFTSTFLPWRHLNHLSLSNYVEVIRQEPLSRWLVNSLFLASTQTVLSVLLCSLTGYALAKHRFRGRMTFTALMAITLLLPPQVLLPGSYELIYRLGWIDTYRAILIPGAASAMGVLLFRQAMLSVPDELLAAGKIDGCSELRLWWEIALPLVRPMIGAFTLLSFTAAWNSFLWPQIVLQNEGKFTLPISLANLSALTGYQNNYGLLMAATVIGVLPVIGLFFALQKEFIAGLTTGAVKG